MAVAEYNHFALLRDRLDDLGAEPEDGDGAVHRRRWRRSTSAPPRATGSRAWSRRTSATASPTDFYREVVGVPRRLDARPGAGGARGHRALGVRGRPGAGGDRGRPAAGRPAGAVGTAAGRRGAEPGAAGGRRAGRAGRPAGGRHRASAAPTSPRSAGCSPGSPRTTPSGWLASACRPDHLTDRRTPGPAPRGPARSRRAPRCGRDSATPSAARRRGRRRCPPPGCRRPSSRPRAVRRRARRRSRRCVVPACAPRPPRRCTPRRPAPPARWP